MNTTARLSTCLILLMSASAAMGQGSLTPSGPPGPTMKSLQEVEPRTAIDALPAAIGVSGSYYLTRNLQGVPSSHGITITANDVTLDLNGFTLLGLASASNGIYMAACTNVAVKNGTVRGWGVSGILGQRAVGCKFTGLTLITNRSDGCSAGDNTVVSDCVATDNGGAGIVTGSGAIISRVTSGRNGSNGICVKRDSVVENCSASYNKTDGIYVAWDSVVANCSANRNEDNGIEVDGSLVKGCSANNNADCGIRLFADSHAYGNNCDGNVIAGIRAGSGNRVDNNNVTDNGFGIYMTSSGLCTRNTAQGNNVTNFSFLAGAFGPVVTASGTMTNLNPWANIEY